ncbi:hypothetical protein LEMLEM_LOCUS27406, partial [Lemmus lemmus]
MGRRVVKRSTFEKHDHHFSTQELPAAMVPSRDLHKTKPVKNSSTDETGDHEAPSLAEELLAIVESKMTNAQIVVLIDNARM